jgi:hypothetical protein
VAGRVAVDDSSHYIDVAADAFQLNSSRIAVLDSGTMALGSASSFIGLLFVSDASQANVGMFYCRGGANAVTEIFDPNSVFTTTKDNAGTFNVYYDSGIYIIQNKRGGTRILSLWTMTS